MPLLDSEGGDLTEQPQRQSSMSLPPPLERVLLSRMMRSLRSPLMPRLWRRAEAAGTSSRAVWGGAPSARSPTHSVYRETSVSRLLTVGPTALFNWLEPLRSARNSRTVASYRFPSVHTHNLMDMRRPRLRFTDRSHKSRKAPRPMPKSTISAPSRSTLMQQQ